MARAKRRRKPKARSKRKVTQRSPTSLSQGIRWSFEHLRFDGPFGWKSIDPDDLTNVIGRLSSWSREGWTRLTNQGDNHFVDTETISYAAKRDLSVKGPPEQLLSLRIDGRKRAFGFREHDIVHLLWWDPEHEICPSPKRYT